MFHGGRHLDFFYEAEWNSKTPLENLAMYYYGSRSTFENIPTRLQNMISSHKTDDLGHGSTSQNDSFSASEDASVLKLQGYKNSTGASGGLPMSTGLKLGRQTYFEAAAAKSTSCSVGPSTKRRSRQSNKQKTRCCCQVEGCKLDLVSAKGYHRRHKICETHSKSPRVIVAGMERRFCQQCSRFHDLSEFDDKKRSCRRRLSNHNARRRRPQPEAAPSSLTLHNYMMNFLPNNSLPIPIPIPIPAANRRRGTDCHLSSVPRTLLYNDASAAALEDAPSLLSSNNSWASNEREPPTSLERLVVHGNHMISLGGQAAETHSNLQNWAAASSSSMEYLLDFNTTGISTQFQHHHHHHPHAS